MPRSPSKGRPGAAAAPGAPSGVLTGARRQGDKQGQSDGGVGKDAKAAASKPATRAVLRRQQLIPDSEGASGSASEVGNPGPDAPAAGGGQQQDQQSRAQQDQQVRQDQQAPPGQQSGEGGGQERLGVAAHMQQLQQLLGRIRALPLDDAVAGLLDALQLLAHTQRELLSDNLVLQEAREREQQRAQQAQQEAQQLRSRVRQLEDARSAAAAAAAGDGSADSQLAAVRAQLADAQARLSSLEGYLRKNGLDPASGRQLQQALERGGQAYMQVAALEQQTKQLQEELAAVKQQAGQAVGEPRGEVMAWAPADMPPDAIGAALADAAGISSGSILAVRRCFVPPHRGGPLAADSRGGAGGGPGGSSSSGQGAESSAQGVGGSGASGQGGDGAGSGEGRGKTPTALYSVILISQRFEGTVLGGRARKVLAHKRVPVWVEQRLSAEERQVRKRLVPLARQLRADGQRTRWRGAVLEQLVQRGSGRRQWERVVPPSPAAGGGGGLGAAAGTSGSGRAP